MRHRRNSRLVYLTLLAPLVLLPVVAGCASANTATNSPLQRPTAQDIRLATDHSSYTTHAPIGIALTNAGQVTYYALDGRSGCTLAQLQVFDASHKAWVSTSGCAGGGKPRSLAIPAGIREPFTLAPGSSSDPNAWQPGTYRVAVAFSSNPDGTSAQIIAASASFVIRG